MRADRHRRPLLHRATALVLSWVFTATTFWSMAPPLAEAAPAPRGPLPALIAGFPENLAGADARTRRRRWSAEALTAEALAPRPTERPRRRGRTRPRACRSGGGLDAGDGGGASGPRVRGGERDEPVHGLVRLPERERGGGDDPGGRDEHVHAFGAGPGPAEDLPAGADALLPERGVQRSLRREQPGVDAEGAGRQRSDLDGVPELGAVPGPASSGAHVRHDLLRPSALHADERGPERVRRDDRGAGVGRVALRAADPERGGERKEPDLLGHDPGERGGGAAPLGPEPERGRSRAGGGAHAHDGAAGEAGEQPRVLPDAEPVRLCGGQDGAADRVDGAGGGRLHERRDAAARAWCTRTWGRGPRVSTRGRSWCSWTVSTGPPSSRSGRGTRAPSPRLGRGFTVSRRGSPTRRGTWDRRRRWSSGWT